MQVLLCLTMLQYCRSVVAIIRKVGKHSLVLFQASSLAITNWLYSISTELFVRSKLKTSYRTSSYDETSQLHCTEAIDFRSKLKGTQILRWTNILVTWKTINDKRYSSSLKIGTTDLLLKQHTFSKYHKKY